MLSKCNTILYDETSNILIPLQGITKNNETNNCPDEIEIIEDIKYDDNDIYETYIKSIHNIYTKSQIKSITIIKKDNEFTLNDTFYNTNINQLYIENNNNIINTIQKMKQKDKNEIRHFLIDFSNKNGGTYIYSFDKFNQEIDQQIFNSQTKKEYIWIDNKKVWVNFFQFS